MKSSNSKNLSIVIVTYNSSTRIVDLMKTIDNERNSKLISEVIIIENNSPDKNITQKVISNYRSRFEIKIKFFMSKINNGFAKSCNKGASLAHSKYVLFLNPDTKLKKNSLEKLIDHAEVLSADLIGGKTIKENGGVHNTVVRIPTILIGLFEFSNLGKLFGINYGHRQFYYEDLSLYSSKEDIPVEALGGAYILAKLKSFNILHGFDEDFFMYLEDVDLGLRANKAGMKVYFCPHSEIVHIGGASSNNKHHIRHQAWYDSRRIYFLKHYGIIVNFIIQPLYIIEEKLLKIRNKYL